jgi:hypothetical protein
MLSTHYLETLNIISKKCCLALKKPSEKKAVGCKWVFIVKHKANGSMGRYKVCLVAKGFARTYGMDYEETLAPVAKMNSIQVLLSLAMN